jgi:membrane protease YdiL (CAAX protease family)
MKTSLPTNTSLAGNDHLHRPEARSRRTAIIDVSTVLSVAAIYVLLESCGVPKRWSYALVAVLLVAFGLVLWGRGTETWRGIGFRTDNLRAAALPIGIATAGLGAALVVWALILDRSPWSRESVLLLVLYPAWALIQQGVFQGILHRRLAFLWPSGWAPVLVTALAFAAVHWGNDLLVALALGAGLTWSMLYRFWPNLWLLGASHSFLAALAYPAVLGDAPLARI